MIRLTASDFYTYFRPSKCKDRIYLKHTGKEEAPPGPYEQVLFRLGERHERSHLATFPAFVDLSKGTLEERKQRTKEEIQRGSSVLYQTVLRSSHKLGGTECDLVGEPDFLIRQENDYVIRDSKISRRITENDHPEILRQLETYGWLYEETFGRPPARLEVHSGTDDIVAVPYDRGVTALKLFEEIMALKLAESEPYSPVGWSKCSGCPFHQYCWPRAEANCDIALVPGVDQSLALALKDQGVNTIEELLRHFNENSFAEFKRPWGKRMQRVGRGATSIIQRAKAMLSRKEYIIEEPSIPIHPNYVMFDLEGLPPHLDELEKIYLWGLQIFGEEKGEFKAAVAGFGKKGDEEGWRAFLKNAKAIFDRYGDIPFVHWHHYERVHIDMYVDRYGDASGIAERVKRNLLDLLPVTQRSIALPLPSYSLKVIEKYIGFKRTLDEYGGDWAMAKYIEAVEAEDPDQRDQVMNEIVTYNREDLEATWAVLNWLGSKAATHAFVP
ncbi:MAG: TM0106 family RecB-like putative nuclease [Thermodesulfobacteriota bacterium]